MKLTIERFRLCGLQAYSHTEIRLLTLLAIAMPDINATIRHLFLMHSYDPEQASRLESWATSDQRGNTARQLENSMA